MYTSSQNEEEVDEIINLEYKVWKYNSHYLYNTLLTNAIEWPSMTVSWLPGIVEDENGIKNQKLILGTHTTGNKQNHLLICNVKLPKEEEIYLDDTRESIEYSYNRDTIDKYKNTKKKIEVEYRINHQGEVNKARPMPQNSDIIATKSPNSEVLLFKYPLYDKKPVDMQVKPLLHLTGHTKEGFGLDWNLQKEGIIISGSGDHKICIWNINDKNNLSNIEKAFSKNLHSDTNDEGNNSISPLHIYEEEHIGIVEDVNFNKIIPDVFASCGDDKKMIIWDMRQSKPVFNIEAHVQEVNCVDFNPFNEYLLLSGSNDKTIALWDLRNLSKKLHSFSHHYNDVINARWNPHIMSVFASSSSDRRIDIWDLSNIGKDTSKEEDVAPSELLFTHGGHTAKVADFDWNIEDEFTIASVSDDNILQVWKMTDKLYYNE